MALEATPAVTPAAAAPAAVSAPAAAQDPVAVAVAALKAQNAPAEDGATVAQATAAPAAPAAEPPKAEPPPAAAEAASLAKARAELRTAQEQWATQKATQERELADKLARLEAFERLATGFDEDPVAYFRALGSKADPLALSRKFFEAGNEANLTQEQKAFLEVRRKAEAAEQRVAELERRGQQEQAQTQLANYRASLVAGFGQIDDTTPLVKSMAARKPEVLAAQMLQIAEHVAATQKRIPTAQDMAAMLEPALRAELEPFEHFYEAKYKPAVPAAAPPVQAAATAIPTNERSVAPTTIGLQHSGRTAPAPDLNEDERRKAAARILRAAHAAQA